MASLSAVPCWTKLVFISFLARAALSASTTEWKQRTVYQTMTDRFARTDGSTEFPCNTTEGIYCGGTWRGTIAHLDYIQGMGFDALMISPIIQNVEGRVSYGEAYHGYWPSDLYSLNSHFGTHQDLLDLSNALHSRGMYLMMDTVINNMAYITNGSNPATNIDYSTLTPFNNSDYFHPYCKITDWNNFTNAQLCQTGDTIVALPDLFTEHSEVDTILESWIEGVVKTYSIDGIRLDAAKHVNTQFLQALGSSVDTFMTGEVLQQEVDTICDYQQNYISSMPNYPLYYAMLDGFTDGNISSLALTVEYMRRKCPDMTSLVLFSENQDIARIASMTKEAAIAKNVIAFTLLFDGIPMIYQGQEQHLGGSAPPENREALWLSGYSTGSKFYGYIATLNKLRKHALSLGTDYVTMESQLVYQGSSEIAFKKGVEGRHVTMLLSNQGSNGRPFNLTLPVSYNAGMVVMDILNCRNHTINNEGELIVGMDKGEPRVFFPVNLLPGSGLCGYSFTNTSRPGQGIASSQVSHSHRLRAGKSTMQALLGTLLLPLVTTWLMNINLAIIPA
ncbi:glycoside hydrolase superfamily [Penicillium hispanicum]|uniref:glycoside hydrolase superfamily n=1 Tax=Penicillium hispanicum TaxID=1080232 RepID=UPI0025411E89|nr:glycoside hydrolase superfamily [Penicillium hispanicum]KAJ5580342.1 glycoside hydrolase superfamily [Penicillium hispanicum]